MHRRRDLLWERGGLVYQEEGLDIEVPLESVTLPALGRAERLGWEVEFLELTPGDHGGGPHHGYFSRASGRGQPVVRL